MQIVRRYSIAAACVLGLLLGASAASAQGTKLLPSDTGLVFTFNVQQVLKSEVVKSNKLILDLIQGQINQQLDDKGVSKYFKAAGFDLFRDLYSVTVAMPGGGRNLDEAIVILEGNFD